MAFVISNREIPTYLFCRVSYLHLDLIRYANYAVIVNNKYGRLILQFIQLAPLKEGVKWTQWQSAFSINTMRVSAAVALVILALNFTSSNGSRLDWLWELSKGGKNQGHTAAQLQGPIA